MASSTNGLVPITRSFLARYYDKYPLDPLPEDVARLTGELRGLAGELAKEFPLSPGEESLAREADIEPPHKVDENLWRNREHIEEILFLLDKSHWPRSLQQKATPEDADIAAVVEDLEVILRKTLKTLELFQLKNADNVFNTGLYLSEKVRPQILAE